MLHTRSTTRRKRSSQPLPVDAMGTPWIPRLHPWPSPGHAEPHPPACPLLRGPPSRRPWRPRAGSAASTRSSTPRSRPPMRLSGRFDAHMVDHMQRLASMDKATLAPTSPGLVPCLILLQADVQFKGRCAFDEGLALIRRFSSFISGSLVSNGQNITPEIQETSIIFGEAASFFKGEAEAGMEYLKIRLE